MTFNDKQQEPNFSKHALGVVFSFQAPAKCLHKKTSGKKGYKELHFGRKMQNKFYKCLLPTFRQQLHI